MKPIRLRELSDRMVRALSREWSWDPTRPLAKQWPWEKKPWDISQCEPEPRATAWEVDGPVAVTAAEAEHHKLCAALANLPDPPPPDPNWQAKVQAAAFASEDTASREPWHASQETQESRAVTVLTGTEPEPGVEVVPAECPKGCVEECPAPYGACAVEVEEPL